MFGRITDWILSPWPALQRRVDEPWYPYLQHALFSSAMFCLGALAALVVTEPWKRPATAVDRVWVDDIEMATGDPRPEALIQLVRDRVQSTVILKGPDFTHQTTWAELGAGVDMQSLGQILVGLARQGSPIARYFRENQDEGVSVALDLPITLRSTAAVEALVSLKERIDRRPQNARFDFKRDRVVNEEVGRAMDVYTTLERLDTALGQQVNEIQLAVEQVPAAISASELQNIDTSAILGFFETRISRMRKDRDRTYNVKLGASMLDGHVIMPQETFSLNGAMGDRNEARGFRYAPVIAGGVLVEGMGGGTCQIASTLYAASFFAGLQTMERKPHSRPSSYIKLGLDATVSYPDLDLKVKNPFDIPIVIHFEVGDGVVRAELRGAKRLYTVTLLRKIVGTQPFPVRTIDDSALPQGEEIVTQVGVPGYTVRRYQMVERDKVGYRFVTMDKYPPTTQFVHRGTRSNGTPLPRGAKIPKADTHPPYRASSYLRMVQGPNGLWYESNHE